MRLSFRSIGFKLAVFIFAVIVTATGIFSVITLGIMDDSIISEVTKRVMSLSRSAAVSAAYSIINKDHLGMDNVVFKVKEAHPDIDYIAVLSPRKKTLAHNDIKKRGSIFKLSEGPVLRKELDGTVVRTSGNTPHTIFEIVTPITYHDKKLGDIVIGINKTMLVSAQTKVHNKMLIWFLMLLTFSVVGIVIFTRRLTRPINELSAGVDQLKMGKEKKLQIYSGDELGKLTQSFNEMSTLIMHQRDKLSAYASELEESYVATVRVLAAAIDARDKYTMGHSTRVAKLSIMLGNAIGLSSTELEELEIACLFHDVGKIRTPDAILHKESKLDRAEFEIIMRHPLDGADILKLAPSLHKYMSAVRHHHEWFNGTGYPDGLKRDAIPLPALIIAIADAYDAMTSKRPYRRSFSEEMAHDELRKFSESQFDPGLTRVFLLELEKQHPADTLSNKEGAAN